MSERQASSKQEGRSLAPRAPAVPPPLLAFPEHPMVLVQPEPRWAAAMLLAGIVLSIGLFDFVNGLGGYGSLTLTAALSLIVLPWAFLVFRPVAPRGTSERRFRALGAQIANTVLVLAVLAAKWHVALTGFGDAPLADSYQSYTAVLIVLLVAGLGLRSGRALQWVMASARHPARLMALSFGVTSLLGALLLALPVSVHRVDQISLLDSLFMSMSAVCVTGLSTLNVAETYTFTGQLVLCVLMQLGGLGIMVLAAAVTMLAGKRLGMRSSAVLAEMIDARSLADLRRTIAMIVVYALTFEAIGVALLYSQFQSIPEIARSGAEPGELAGAGGPLWAAIFHSVSAFCNCGLSNFRSGYMPLAGATGACQIVAVLIVLGGLGFPVIHELVLRTAQRLRKQPVLRVTLHTRLAISTSAVLLAGMAIGYFVLERGASFGALGFVDRLNAAVFQSAAARTAGFNVVDFGLMHPATLLLTCLAMFIGGNPGSTAGGIKTTTFAVLFAAFRGELRRMRPRLFDRSVPEAVVRRAIGVAFLSISLIAAIVFLLLLTERHQPFAVVFEVVSAFSTTGLSTGITPSLSAPGKLLITATMLIGRVGPLTMALALAASARAPAYQLPEERVMIG